MNKNKDHAKVYFQILDIICIIVSFIGAVGIRYGFKVDNLFGTIYGFIFILILLSYVCFFNIFDFFTGIFKRGFYDEFISVFQLNMLLLLFMSAILFMLQRGSVYSRFFFACFFFLNVWITYIARQYLKVILLAYYKKSGSSNKVFIITTSDQALNIINRMRQERLWEYLVTGFVIMDRDMVGETIAGLQVKGNKDNLFEVITKDIVDEVFISLYYDKDLKLNEIILQLENMGITVNLSVTTFDLDVREKTIQNLGGYPVLTFSTKVFDFSSLLLKRAMDILGAIVGLVLTAIICIIIAPAILIESKGPLVFSQIRVGKNGRRFKIYKFRSMYQDAEEKKQELMALNEMDGLMFKITDDPRITKVGKFIRKTSIDELPQFFNVLKGDMSLVGTRPPTEDEFLQYEGRHKRRLTLKPGITGLWQVSGRSDIENFEEVVKMDLDYIDHWSIWLDMKLLMKTVVVVVFGRGAK